MKMLDLFSGIGGFALAAKWVWEDELDIVGFCEIDKYAQKVLQKNFPGVPIHEDITKLDGKDFKNIDLITGGFPCQDISIAGKGEGITGKRSGLWSEMHRLISHIRPRYVIIENVPMLTVRGGTRVISDLAEAGYDAEWQIVGADDVGAWHRRKRIWIVSHTKHDGRYGVQEPEGSGSRIHSQAGQSRAEQSKGSDSGKGRSEDLAHPHRVGEKRDQSQDRQGIGTEQTRQDVPDSDRNGDRTSKFRINKHGKTQTQRSQCEVSRPQPESGGYSEDVPDTDSTGRRERRRSESVQETFHSSECDSQRFPADYWLTEPDVGRVANGIPNRVDRLKGLGNAIVPQVAALIMERIKDAEI